MKHLVKEDGRSLKVDDKADFRILEFSKENKRILVSHNRIHEEKANQARSAEFAEKGKEREEERCGRDSVTSLASSLESLSRNSYLIFSPRTKIRGFLFLL